MTSGVPAVMNTHVDARITSLEHTELISRIWWLIRLRWVFGVGVTAIGVICAYEPTLTPWMKAGDE